MQVQVLRAGVFNGPGHKALPWANEGAVIEVADGPYAVSLIADGLVMLPVVDVPEGGGQRVEIGGQRSEVRDRTDRTKRTSRTGRMKLDGDGR